MSHNRSLGLPAFVILLTSRPLAVGAFMDEPSTEVSRMEVHGTSGQQAAVVASKRLWWNRISQPP